MISLPGRKVADLSIQLASASLLAGSPGNISLEFLGRGPGNPFLQKKGFPGKLLLDLFRPGDFFHFLEGFVYKDKEHRLAFIFDAGFFQISAG